MNYKKMQKENSMKSENEIHDQNKKFNKEMEIIEKNQR